MSDLVQLSYPPRDYHRKKPRWYHSAMIDWMMANPGGSMADLAKHVNRKLPTVSAIVRSDMFQAALAERKRQFSAAQDTIVREKLTEVTIKSLDTVLAVLERKKDTIPLETLSELSNNTLQRLGYGIPKAAAPSPVQVNVNQTNQVAVPVSPADLQEARGLMHSHQSRLASAPREGAVLPAPADTAEKSEEGVVASVIPQP